MEIECPLCEVETELDCGELPDRACDSAKWKCPNCEAVMDVGWYATAEVRSAAIPVSDEVRDE